MEIYKDNDPNKPVRPQVQAFHLPSEPWLFVIGRNGKIDDEIEGAFGVEELTTRGEGLTARMSEKDRPQAPIPSCSPPSPRRRAAAAT